MASAVGTGRLELVGTLHLGALRQDVSLLRHRSGIRIAHCPLPGPLCQADIIIPTECHDNGGLPHCLEHLVFMGSQRHPARGFLDKLANLCISSGTNAWTDRDHTAYNAVTAGPQGLRRLLPVLLDHVFSPTLTDEQFHTEVYCVDHEGRAKGVVFCEMQGREATEDDLSDHNVHELLYADSGYRFECGGLTPDIARISNAKVRQYHKQHYAPANSLILVHGQLSQDALEAALDEWMMHAKVLDADCDSTRGGQRAWCRVPAALAAPASRTVDFGAEDEAVGSVVLGWSGPMIGDVVTITALEVLFRFLQEGSASPLAQHFVECAHPLASAVDFDLELRLRTCFSLTFSGVPNGNQGGASDCEAGGDADASSDDDDSSESNSDDGEDIDDVEPGPDGNQDPQSDSSDPHHGGVLQQGVFAAELTKVLRDLLSAGFPPGAISKAIDRHWVKILEECEDGPAEALQRYLLPELVFEDHVKQGLEQGQARPTALNTKPILDGLRAEPEDFWKALLAKWVVDAPMAEVVMRPSVALVKLRADKEQEGIMERRRALGEAGLAQCKKDLEAAMSANAPQPLPHGLPSTPPSSSIPSLPFRINRLVLPHVHGRPPWGTRAETGQSVGGTTVQIVRTHTSFHSVAIGFDCRHVPGHLRPWLVLLQEVLMSSDVIETDGSVTSYTTAITQRQQQTVNMWTGVGWSGGTFSSSVMSEQFFVCGTALPTKDGFPLLCEWLGKLVGHTQITAPRVAVCAKNLNKDITASLRDGESVCEALVTRLTAHQLLSSLRPPNAGQGQKKPSRKGGKPAIGDAPEPMLGGGAERGRMLAGARNDVAVSLLAQKPLVQALAEHLRTSRGAGGCAALDEAVAKLQELRRHLVFDDEAGCRNAVFVQICAPKDGDEFVDDEALMHVLGSHLDRALERLVAREAEHRSSQTKKARTVRTRAPEPNLQDTVRSEYTREGEMRIASAGVQRQGVAEQALVVAVKGSDSSYLQMAVPCGLHKSAPGFAAVQLLCEVLSRSEGPLWERIRGRGLAYHASLYLSPWAGQLIFEVSECADPAAVVKEMLLILAECREQLADAQAGGNALSTALAEARASVLFSLHSKRATAGAGASTAAKAYWWGVQDPEEEVAAESAALESVPACSSVPAFAVPLPPTRWLSCPAASFVTPCPDALPGRSCPGAPACSDENVRQVTVCQLLEALDTHLAQLTVPGRRCTAVTVPAGQDAAVAAALADVLKLDQARVHVAPLPQLLIPIE